MTTAAPFPVIGGRYTLGRVIGRGGMGTVYFASDTTLQRPVAVKLVAEHLIDDPMIRRRFLREARLAAQLSHPSIVQVFDAGEEDERPYIVMEYVEGETLASVLKRRGRLPHTEVVPLAVQICAGLEHAHKAGLVHRDIKPRNLLIKRGGGLKIADFGIARADEATHPTQPGQVVGTAGYLAPEQAAGESLTPAADLYSVGAVLYELLTGEKPYRFNSLPELLTLQAIGDIRPARELVPDLPENIDRTIRLCLATDPQSRPGSAAELANELLAPAADDHAPSDCTTLSVPSEAATIALSGAGTNTVVLPRARRLWPKLNAARTALTRTRVRVLIAVAAIAAVLSIILATTLPTSNGTLDPQEPIPRSHDPAEQARDLATWLRTQTR